MHVMMFDDGTPSVSEEAISRRWSDLCASMPASLETPILENFLKNVQEREMVKETNNILKMREPGLCRNRHCSLPKSGTLCPDCWRG